MDVSKPATVQSFVARALDARSLSLLSDTNNYIYKAEIENRICAIKVMLDEDIPTDYLVRCMAQLGSKVTAPEIYDVRYRNGEDEFDLIVMEYVEGQSLLHSIGTSDETLHDAVANNFLQCLEICGQFEPYMDRIGLFKVDAPSFDSISAFNEHYLSIYWQRCQPFIKDSSFSQLVDEWLSRTGALAAEVDDSAVRLSPVDLNLKNFLVRGDDIVILNIPILGNTHPAHGLGAASAQLRHFRAGEIFRQRIDKAYPNIARHWVNYFEIWMLMGILAFYAARQPDNLSSVKNWGSPVPLMEDIGALIEQWHRSRR